MTDPRLNQLKTEVWKVRNAQPGEPLVVRRRDVRAGTDDERDNLKIPC